MNKASNSLHPGTMNHPSFLHGYWLEKIKPHSNHRQQGQTPPFQTNKPIDDVLHIR